MNQNLGINIADYASGNLDNQVLFDSGTSQGDLNELNKALEAGQITGRETTNLTTASGAPLKVESLEKTLKLITFRESDIVLFKRIPKKPAFNTVEEYNQQTSYGTDRGGFYNEGELPLEEDSTFVRRAQLVKFLGVTRSVTHQMTLVNTVVGNPTQKAVQDGMMWILRKLNRSLYNGNGDVVPQEFYGLLTQHAQNPEYTSLNAYFNSEVIIDMRGAKLSESAMETAANSIVENFGQPDQFFAPPKVISEFVKNFYGNKFIPINTAANSAGKVGMRVQEFESQFGPIGLNKDVFFNKLPTKTTVTGATHPNAANAPTADGVAPIAAVGADASGKWAASDAGSYFYAVTAINRYGESAVTVLGASTAIVTGGAVDLKFAATASTYATTGYRIYRSDKGAASAAAATFYPVFDISIAQLAAGYDGAAALLVRDRNRFMPNTDQAFMTQFDNEVLDFAQLAPMMKMDLAIISPAYRFMVLLYGTPFLYAPKKMVRFINIGLL
jgi:hypothetical protein